MSQPDHPESNIEALLTAAYEVAQAQERLGGEEQTHRDYNRELDDRLRYSIRPLPGTDNLQAVRRVSDESDESYEEWSGAVTRTREWQDGTKSVTPSRPFKAYYFFTGTSDDGRPQFKFFGSSKIEGNLHSTWVLTIDASQLADVEIVEKIGREETAKWVGKEALDGAASSLAAPVED
jgi:hypothetical protein